MKIQSGNQGFGSHLAAWRSPSNIALVKYWGKLPGQLPCNPSISFTLRESYTECSIQATPSQHGEEQILFSLHFHEQPASETFRSRIASYLESVRLEVSFLPHYLLRIHTMNNFPHSSGIASSASAMSSIALCISTLDKMINPNAESWNLHHISSLARMGSGSAARSIYGGIVLWGESEYLQGSSNEYALPVTNVHKEFHDWGDAILIVDSARKKVSSSEGHERMKKHFYRQGREEQATVHTGELLTAFEKGDTSEFVRIVENEALSLHGLMMSSDPSFILLEEKSISIVNLIRAFRQRTGIPACFTIDAGPNIHLLYPWSEREAMLEFIREDLLPFCEGQSWIDDRMGNGPEPLI
jgi:diphosphomevalonate decarboxylase